MAGAQVLHDVRQPVRLEQRRLAVVDAGGVDADRADLTVCRQPARRVGMQAGKVKLRNGAGASFVCAHVLHAIGPVLCEAGAQQDDRATRNRSGEGLDRLQAGPAAGERSPAEATIFLTPVEDPSAFGVVPTEDDGRVISFVEKPAPGEAPTNLINAGTYVLEPSVLDRIAPGRRVSIEYALIRDVNDQPWRADLLGRLLADRRAHVNLIPLNPTPGSTWTASRPEDEYEFVRRLVAKGIPTTVRDTRGSDIDGACGQLAAVDA